jgi:hypothetical protein
MSFGGFVPLGGALFPCGAPRLFSPSAQAVGRLAR